MPLEPNGQPIGAITPQLLQAVLERRPIRVPDRVERGTLTLPKTHLHREITPKSYGLGVVIAMDVSHEEVGDVCGAALERCEGVDEHRSRLGEIPAGVDADKAVLAGDDVHVDSLQPVLWQRKGYPVDPVDHLVGARRDPAV